MKMRMSSAICAAAGLLIGLGAPAQAIIYGTATHRIETSVRYGTTTWENNDEAVSVLTDDPASNPAPVAAATYADPEAVRGWIAPNGQFAVEGGLGRTGTGEVRDYIARAELKTEGVINDGPLPVSMNFGWLVDGGYIDLADSIGVSATLHISVSSLIWDANGALIFDFEETTHASLSEYANTGVSVIEASNYAVYQENGGPPIFPVDDDFELGYRAGAPNAPMFEYDYSNPFPLPARYIEIPTQIKLYDYGIIPAGGSASYGIAVEMRMLAGPGAYTGDASFAFADPLSASFGQGERLLDPPYAAAAAPVPLPAAAPLMLAGLAALGFAAKRRA
jgi:hypothetical protein